MSRIQLLKIRKKEAIKKTIRVLGQRKQKSHQCLIFYETCIFIILKLYYCLKKYVLILNLEII